MEFPRNPTGRKRLFCTKLCYSRARKRREPPAQVAAQQARFAAKRRAIIDAAKAVPCSDCGIQYPPVCMDFDHVRGAKSFTIGYDYRGALDRVLEEIAKCDVRCANCHRLRHAAERDLVC